MSLRIYWQKAQRYRRVHGTRRLITESLARLSGDRRRLLPSTVTPGIPLSALDDIGWVNVRELVRINHSATWPLRLFEVPNPGSQRVSMVTDSINPGQLYGGVGTAMIMSALLAEAQGARLRLVTRVEPAEPAALYSVLKTYGITLTREVEFAFAPFHDGHYEIDTLPGETYVTTSWWSTASTLGSVPASQVIYLLQEDERMFYAYGDEHLRCSRVLENPSLRVVVNTRLLFDHLVGSGLSYLKTSGLWFEPAFPSTVFHPRETPPSAKRTLMFYARPNNLRNLFMFGLELIETAITRGVLDLREWDIVLVGKDIPKLHFDDGKYNPKRLEKLSWTEYADFAGTVDLALCLMYTPHPSYPPFDLAASGAVVVTNAFGPKQQLDHYSKNIVTGEPNISSMLAALAEGVRLATSTDERRANYEANQLASDWTRSFAPVVEHFTRTH